MWWDNRRWIVSLDEALWIIKDLYFGHKWQYKVEMLKCFFFKSLQRTLIDGLEYLCITVMFLSDIWAFILMAPIAKC